MIQMVQTFAPEWLADILHAVRVTDIMDGSLLNDALPYEEPIGVIDKDPFTRQLFSRTIHLLQQVIELAKDEAERQRVETDLLTSIFWTGVRLSTSCTAENIGVRKGWKLVSWTEEDRDKYEADAIMKVLESLTAGSSMFEMIQAMRNQIKD